MGKQQVGAQLVLVARHGMAFQCGVCRQLADRFGDRPGQLLVVPADFPQPGERHRGAAQPAAVASGNWKTCFCACRSRSSRPSSSGLNFACGAKLPAVRQIASQANRIRCVSPLSFLVLGKRNSSVCGPAFKRQLAQLQPGHLAPEGDVHQVGREFVGPDPLPLAVIDPPIERRTGEFEPDPAPDLVRCVLRAPEMVFHA